MAFERKQAQRPRDAPALTHKRARWWGRAVRAVQQPSRFCARRHHRRGASRGIVPCPADSCQGRLLEQGVGGGGGGPPPGAQCRPFLSPGPRRLGTNAVGGATGCGGAEMVLPAGEVLRL